MFDYIKIINDLKALGFDYSRFVMILSSLIGLCVGLVMAYIGILDNNSSKVRYNLFVGCISFIATSALTALFFNFAISVVINPIVPKYNLSYLKSVASENGVNNLDNLDYNVEYLFKKYTDSTSILNYGNKDSEDAYSYNPHFNKLKDISSYDYVNYMLNKFYLDRGIDSYVEIALDNSDLSYDSIYKELRR
jgi:hypothetical protein